MKKLAAVLALVVGLAGTLALAQTPGNLPYTSVFQPVSIIASGTPTSNSIPCSPQQNALGRFFDNSIGSSGEWTCGPMGVNGAWIWYRINAAAPGIGLTVPVVANWSVLGSGCTTGTTNVFNLTGVLQVISPSATTATCGWQIPSSGTFSHIFVIAGMLSPSNYSSALVGFTDGTKYESCGIGTNGFATTITGISALTLTGTVGANNGGTGIGGSLGNTPYYFRLSATGGTNLKCEYSPDQGSTWFAIFNDTTPYLTPNALFVGTNQRGAAGNAYAWLLSYQ